MLNRNLSKLVVLLESCDQYSIGSTALESAVTDILLDEGFDDIPEDVKDEVYFLDMYDLEKPTPAQIKNSIDVIKSYLLNLEA